MIPFDGKSSARYRAPIVILLLLAFAIRIWRLDVQPLSGDEAFSIMNWTRTSLDHLLGVIALIDPQPPAAFLSLYGWVRLVGDTEFATRMLSVLASTMTVSVAYSITRLLLNKSAALMAAVLTALNPYQIWYAQDLRSYSLWMACSAATLWLFLRILKYPNRPGYWAAYILGATIGIYTFYLELFMIAAHNLFAIWSFRSSSRYLTAWFGVQAGIAILLAPWFFRPELRRSGYEPTGGAPDLANTMTTLTIGRTFPSTPELLLGSQLISVPVLLVLVLLTMSLIVVWRSNSKATALLLALGALIPPALLSLLVLITGKGYFNPRYVSASSLSLILLIAAALYTMSGRKRIWRTVALLTSGLLATLYTRSLAHYYFDGAYAKAPAWREVVALLDTQTAPADVIIRNFPDPAFDYYYRGPTPSITLPISENAPAAGTHVELARLINAHNYVWFLPVESAAFDEDRTVATWLEVNSQLISDQWVGATQILQYASWESIPTAYSQPPPIDFANTATLFGYRVTPPLSVWDRNTTIFLELLWQPYRATDQPLTLFVHLLGPVSPEGSPLWAQDDHPPQHGRLSTLSWPLNRPFRDVYRITIPANTPPGEYALTAGLYDPITGDRVPVSQEHAFAENNAATLLSFTLP